MFFNTGSSVDHQSTLPVLSSDILSASFSPFPNTLLVIVHIESVFVNENHLLKLFCIWSLCLMTIFFGQHSVLWLKQSLHWSMYIEDTLLKLTSDSLAHHLPSCCQKKYFSCLISSMCSTSKCIISIFEGNDAFRTFMDSTVLLCDSLASGFLLYSRPW